MGHKTQASRPVNRGGYWYLLRRVPKEYASLDTRAFVKISTGIRVVHDPRGIEAQIRVAKLDHDLQTYWRRLAAGESAELAQITLHACRHALTSGVPALPFEETRKLSLTEIYQRLHAAVGGTPVAEFLKGQTTPELLGKPQLAWGLPASSLKPLKQGPRVSQLIEEAERIASVSMANKSADQLRKWRAPKETAVAVFRKTIDGDPLLSELTVTDVHPFRDHWQNRILADEVKVNTANRMMKHVSGLYANIANHYHFEARNPFHGILFKNADDASRPPYDTDYIQAQFLAEGMFEDLNPEARRVIYLMIETGVRPSEACGLHRRAIHLDAPIPYISVTTETRDTKTRGSVRDIPLVGAALMAMKLQRDGFPRYADKPNQLTTLIGAALSARKLKPTPKHSLYSLRHSLMDRLRSVGAPENVQKDIAGHRYLYGKGTSLELRYAYLQKSALTPPSQV